jgi:hypothetical protein
MLNHFFLLQVKNKPYKHVENMHLFFFLKHCDVANHNNNKKKFFFPLYVYCLFINYKT